MLRCYLHYIQESTCTYNVRLVECKSWNEGFHLKTRCLRHEQYDTYIKFAKSQRGLQTEHGFSIWHKRFDAFLQIMRGKKVSVFGMKPFKSGGWVLNLLVLSQFLGIQEEKLHHWWNQTFWLFFREADKETNVVLKCIYLIKWRKERNKNQFYKLICQKHEHRVFPLIPSPHMLALLDLPDLSSVAYTLKNWPNEMAFLV